MSAEDGPRLVRGVETVVDAAGTASLATRPVVALCTCGGTGRAPWCDATHKVIAARAAARAAAAEQD